MITPAHVLGALLVAVLAVVLVGMAVVANGWRAAAGIWAFALGMTGAVYAAAALLQT